MKVCILFNKQGKLFATGSKKAKKANDPLLKALEK
jgi:hypothetical protein